MGTAVFLKEFGKIRPVGHFPGLGQTLNFLLCSYTVGGEENGIHCRKTCAITPPSKFFYPKEVEKEMKGVMTIHIIPGKMPDEQRRIYFSECR